MHFENMCIPKCSSFFQL